MAMKQAGDLPWWAVFAMRRQQTFAETTDRADMGTAFGLDASFPAPSESPEADPATPADAASKPWEHRLTRRSGL
jgi:hypothetical protein